MKKVMILWTGGWDSTFRLLQLAENEIQIQPVYLIHKDRAGTKYEKVAMQNILTKIKQDKSFKAEILETKLYEVDWVLENCKDDEISKAYQYLHKKYKVGKQYEWFALLCKKLNIKMETAVVHQYHGVVEDAIEAEGVLKPIEEDILEGRYHVLPGGGQKAFLVFGNLILPVINLTKQDEGRIAREKGWMDIMELTWFCHSPINGKPCGFCNPCDDAMHTGMEWRLPKEAQNRNKHRTLYRYINKAKKIVNKIIKTEK